MQLKTRSLIILTSGILISIIVRSFLIIHGNDTADVKRMHEVGQAVLDGINPYLTHDFYIYPPLWMHFEAMTLWLSNLFNIPFHILIKVWPNMADILITIILFKFLLRLNISYTKASLWSLVFILNPVSIIISASHGQFDSVPSLLVLLAIYLLTFYSTKTYIFMSALLMGLAIAFKPNPVMLLPLLLIQTSKVFRYALLSAIPVLLTLLPYLIMNFHATTGSVFSYSGVYDFGYASILKAIWYQQNANIWPPYLDEMLNITKFTFLFASSALFLIFWGQKTLVRASLAVYLLFLTFYSGISAQYLVWILPFAVIERSKAIIPFSFSATVALLGFYLFFGPEILLGNLKQIPTFQSDYMLLYFVGNLMLWATVLLWSLNIFKKYTKITWENIGQFRKTLVVSLLIALVISLIPVFYMAIKIVQLAGL